MEVPRTFTTWIGARTPWRILNWLRQRSPSTFQRLVYGTPNLNTADHWDERWNRHGTAGFRATGEAQPLRDRAVRAVPPGSDVLDVGCGVGETIALLRDQRRCRCSGCDIAASAAAAVTAQGMTGRVSVLPDIDFPDEAFDVVICTETLEHVTDAAGTVRSLRRVLRPEGLLLMSVPDGSVDEEASHVHRFTEASIRRLLSRYFSVVSIELVELEKPSAPSFFIVARPLPAGPQ